MRRVNLSQTEQALIGLMNQEPSVAEADRLTLKAAAEVIARISAQKKSLPLPSSLLQNAWHMFEGLIRTINVIRLKAQERAQAYRAEVSKGYLAGQAMRVQSWTEHLEFARLPGRNVGPLSVKMVYDVWEDDLDGTSDTRTEVLCEGPLGTWYCLVAWSMHIIDVVQISPTAAKDLLSKIEDAKAIVAAHEAASSARMNDGASIHHSDKPSVVNNLQYDLSTIAGK